jgi:hypothetical protein
MTQLLEKLVIDRIGSARDIEEYVAIHRRPPWSKLVPSRVGPSRGEGPYSAFDDVPEIQTASLHTDPPAEVTQLRASVIGMFRAINMNRKLRARPIRPLDTPKRTACRP